MHTRRHGKRHVAAKERHRNITKFQSGGDLLPRPDGGVFAAAHRPAQEPERVTLTMGNDSVQPGGHGLGGVVSMDDDATG